MPSDKDLEQSKITNKVKKRSLSYIQLVEELYLHASHIGLLEGWAPPGWSVGVPSWWSSVYHIFYMVASLRYHSKRSH